MCVTYCAGNSNIGCFIAREPHWSTCLFDIVISQSTSAMHQTFRATTWMCAARFLVDWLIGIHADESIDAILSNAHVLSLSLALLPVPILMSGRPVNHAVNQLICHLLKTHQMTCRLVGCLPPF